MRKTADRGERKHLVVHNIDPLCFEAVAKIVSYLESQEIRTERVPDMDPGSDTNWTELWAEW